MIRAAKLLGSAHDYSNGEVEGLSDLTRSDAELLNTMSGEGFDNAVFCSGMGENGKQEYAAFKDEFLNTDWTEAWEDAQDACGKYSLESANMGTIEFRVIDEYVNDSYDFSVRILSTGASCNFYEIYDGEGAGEMFAWLIKEGVKFESKRSLWFNVHYVSCVMINKERTRSQLIDEAASLTEEELDKWFEYTNFEDLQTEMYSCDFEPIGTEMQATIELSRAFIEDVAEGALSCYPGWIDSFGRVEPSKGKYLSEHIANGGTFKVHDCVEDKWHTVTAQQFADATATYIQKLYVDKTWSGYLDDATAEAVLQIACFGDIIYG